jgi:tripeptidyl-peptidase I
MKLTVTLTLLAASAVGAMPSGHYVLHESRRAEDISRRRLTRRTASADGDAIIPLKIGLTQFNLHTGYDRLMDVAHPSSANFGKHLSQEEVIELFAPQEDTVSTVRDWLVESGVDATRIKHYQNKGWLAIDMPISEAESLFRTQYYEVEHKGAWRLGCDEYYVPQHIQEHIDYITPGVKLSPPMRKRTVTARGSQRKRTYKVELPEVWADLVVTADLPDDLAGCAKNFTPPCYRAL